MLKMISVYVLLRDFFFFSLPFNFFLLVNFAAPYWIIDTDYKNYSIVWSCTNFGIISTREYLIKLT